jgi:hypothetical protein
MLTDPQAETLQIVRDAGGSEDVNSIVAKRFEQLNGKGFLPWARQTTVCQNLKKMGLLSGNGFIVIITPEGLAALDTYHNAKSAKENR